MTSGTMDHGMTNAVAIPGPQQIANRYAGQIACRRNAAIPRRMTASRLAPAIRCPSGLQARSSIWCGTENGGTADYLLREVFMTKRGDADLDGRVDFGDFLTLSASFSSTDAVWETGDFDGDGEVAFADFLWLAANFADE